MTVNSSPGPEYERMQENARDAEEHGLSPKQEQLILELVSGKNIRDACKMININEATAYRWMKQPLFQKTYQDAKHIAYNEKLDTLRAGIGIAIKTLLQCMTSEAVPDAVKVRAAQVWLSHSLSVHHGDELQRMHAEILRRLDELGVKP